MAWKLIEVGDYDENALTDTELMCIGYALDDALDNTNGVLSIGMANAILKITDDLNQAIDNCQSELANG